MPEPPVGFQAHSVSRIAYSVWVEFHTLCRKMERNPGGCMDLLVTGGAGFIGSNFVRYWLERYPEDRLLNLDLLTYAGNLASLEDVVARFSGRYAFVRGDIGNVEL